MTTGSRWRPWLLTAAVLLVGLLATTGAAVGSHQSLERDRAARFDGAAERARGTVAGRLQLHIQNLAQLRNWMLVTPGATSEDFHRFTALGLDAGQYPGVQALSFAPRVARSDLPGFAASIQPTTTTRGEAYPAFVVHPISGAPTAYPITYIEPIAGNEPAYGFDLATDPPRLDAIEAARDRGQAVGSGPLRLVQETGDQAGFVLWSPVYDTGDVPNTAPARRRHFLGVVSEAFRVGDMFSGVFGANPEADAEMYDLGPTTETAAVRFDATNRILNTKPEVAVSPQGAVHGLHRDLDLSFGGHRWRMVLTPSSGFLDGPRTLPWVVTILGGLVSLLLAGIVHSTTRARGRAERRAMEMTTDLRTAEARTQSIIQGAPDAMLVVDGDGTISRVNLATESLFGYPTSELEGRPIELLLPGELGDAHRAHRASYLDAPRRREMGAELELLGRRRDGSTFPLEVSLSPLVGPDGSLEVIAAVRDVSERRSAQAALQAALDHERETAEQLREADELKTTFLNTISHELRTPLTAISGFTELLLSASLTPEQRSDYLQRVRRNAESLSTLVVEVLAFARLDHHEVMLNPTQVDLSTEVQRIVDQLSPIIGGHTVVIDAPDPVVALVDREALTRILANLLTNVARYSPTGTTVTIAVEHRDDRAVLAVSDEGPGIPPDEERRVFDRFFRGATALATRVPGTGVGLAVVSELAHRSGGSVRVASSDGRGACFEVELPARAPE